jgi:RNA-binding protein YhbY
MTVGQVQLGKNGITENFILTLKNHFNKHKNVKVSVLKSACRDREELKKISNEIVEKLGKNYKARVIGFKIAIMKLRKSRE